MTLWDGSNYKRAGVSRSPSSAGATEPAHSASRAPARAIAWEVRPTSSLSPGFQRSPEESEVLFTLIAERYERRSLGITSNLVFSQWEHIFANPMATAAAIDRVVPAPP